MGNSFLLLTTVIGLMILGGVISGTSSSPPINYAFAGNSNEDSPDSNSIDQTEDTVSETDENEANTEDTDGDGDGASSVEGDEGDIGNNQSNTELQSLSTIKKKNDNVPPAIISVKPNYGTTNIPITTTIEASFNEPVQESTISTSTFMVRSASDMSQVSGIVSLSADDKTAIFTPNALSPSTSYKVTVSTGVKDLAGNSMTSDENWTFTTMSGGSGSGSGNTGFENLGDILGLTLPNANLDAAKATPANNNNSSDFGVINKDVITLPKGEAYIQLLNDAELVDRILPLIVEKIDVNTLISRADGRKLLEKVLPYVDVKISASQQPGPKSTIDVTGIAKNLHRQHANCNLGETLVGGGYEIASSGLGANTPTTSWRNGGEWSVIGDFSVDGSIQAYAECLSVEVGIKP